MTGYSAGDLARQLAARAEDACRHYLSNGTRAGRYWQVGDVYNTKGRSLYVRLYGPLAGPGAAGKWTDSAAAGQHGDLLDLIRLNRDCRTLAEAMAEARAFLALPPGPEPPRIHDSISGSPPPCQRSATEAARRLFAAGHPITGTLAETYLRTRGINIFHGPALRFHPAVQYRAHDGAPLQRLPALIAAVTDHDGEITGVHRTWLATNGRGLAPLPSPRRALGALLGHGVRFPAIGSSPANRLIVGEGIETVLSVRSALPDWPTVAALSANHLAALIPPPGLTVLAIARDDDEAGRQAARRLRQCAQARGITVIDLVPRLDDFNEDLRRFGLVNLQRRLRDRIGTP